MILYDNMICKEFYALYNYVILWLVKCCKVYSIFTVVIVTIQAPQLTSWIPELFLAKFSSCPGLYWRSGSWKAAGGSSLAEMPGWVGGNLWSFSGRNDWFWISDGWRDLDSTRYVSYYDDISQCYWSYSIYLLGIMMIAWCHKIVDPAKKE